jgi:hypothetical protein
MSMFIRHQYAAIRLTAFYPSASSPSYYIAHLTSLLESIALIVDQHQTVVEKYYGEGRMEVVVKRLQLEADGFVKQLVEGWEDERRVGRLVSRERV